MSKVLRRRLLDVVPPLAILALGVAGLAGLSQGSTYRGDRVVELAFLTLATLPLVERRRSAPHASLLSLLAVSAWVSVYYHSTHQPPFEPFLAAVMASFALGLHTDDARLRAALVAFAAMTVAGTAGGLLLGMQPGNVVPAAIWTTLAVAFGRALRERQELVELLRDRSARLERDHERDVAEAAASERARIARELHDVIAHAVSLVVLQAQAERRLLDPEERRTIDALETIETSGREALTELRRLLGVLRQRPDDERLAPQPGLESLPRLVEEAERGGQSVRLSATGPPAALSAGLDLAAYRIVQEALTNARKHAPGAHADVRLAWSPAELRIEVVDDGRPRAQPGPRTSGKGHGLIGMRERTRLYGGRCEVGPAPGGGFRVAVRLPIEAAS